MSTIETGEFTSRTRAKPSLACRARILRRGRSARIWKGTKEHWGADMLDYVEFRMGKGFWRFDLNVRGTYPLARALDFWMAELARDHLRLGLCFRALAIMLQVPGAAGYEWLGDDDDEFGNATWHRLRDCDQNTLLNVLADCLARLGADELLKQVPGAEAYQPDPVSKRWKKWLDKREALESGLLNVIAECLDRLIVRPGLAEITRPAETPWWQRWWSRME